MIDKTNLRIEKVSEYCIVNGKNQVIKDRFYSEEKAAEWLEEVYGIKHEAADTIESLSEKLQAANVERSAEDCGSGIISLEECIDILKESKRQSEVILQNPTVFYSEKSMVGGCETMKKHIEAYSMAINYLEKCFKSIGESHEP